MTSLLGKDCRISNLIQRTENSEIATFMLASSTKMLFILKE
jgi:hypothetical protein